MKTKLLLFIILQIQLKIYAQFGEQQIISMELSVVRSLDVADLDGDGDMDVISASEGDDKVAWYENTDGLGNFGTQQIITQSLQAAIDVYAVDLDDDDDMDILVASKGFSQNDGKIVWFENTDGLGNFSGEQIISTFTDGAISVYAEDLDGDGDMDVLSASFSDNKIAWYENTDGLGNFGSQQIITTNALSTRDVYSADLDGDGDMDVLVAATASHEVIWFENTDGLGNFGSEQIISTNASSVLSVYAADLDGDGDLDVLSASLSDDKIAWYENTDGLGNFGLQQIITTSLGGQNKVYATDLDNDGDIDVLSSAPGEDVIAWYENIDGLGNFNTHIITTDIAGARAVHASDLDNDGDIDVLSVSSFDEKLAWYENLTILGLEEAAFAEVVLFPNPVNDILNIENINSITINSIKVYDLLGRLVLVGKNNFDQLNISLLKNGLFLIKIETDKGVLTKKIVKN